MQPNYNQPKTTKQHMLITFFYQKTQMAITEILCMHITGFQERQI